MSTWLLQVGGTPVSEDQQFDAAPAENTWVLNDSWQSLTTFAAAPAEGSWGVTWALHDSVPPFIGWASGTLFFASFAAVAVGVATVSTRGLFKTSFTAIAIGVASVTDKVIFKQTISAIALGIASAAGVFISAASEVWRTCMRGDPAGHYRNQY